MSDVREAISVDGGMPKFVSGVALAVNQTYSMASGHSLFCALIPAYMKDYAYRYILPALQWLDGYVSGWHDSESGILSTRLASRLITGLTKQVVGEKLMFVYTDKDQSETNETLAFVGNWAQEQNVKKSVYSSIGWALATGTSVLKANVTADHKVWWEAVRIDNAFYSTDFRGNVQEASFLIRGYSDTRKERSTQQFFLAEHRYYETCDKPLLEENRETGEIRVIRKKGERIPMVEYTVYRVNGTMQNNTMPTASMSDGVPWEQLPYDIRHSISKDYGVMVGKPQRLPFPELGVRIMTNGNIDLSVPNGQGFGESLIIPVISDLITYEYGYSCRIRDMHLGKGTVYQPKSLTMSDIAHDTAKNGILNAYRNDSPIELMKGVDPEKQKAIVQQFEIRAEEWQKVIDDALKGIAVKWGMSPKILASYLAQGSAQQTATQIDSEDDQSIAFINLCRSYFSEQINSLLELTMNFYGKPANVSVKFASPSLLNKDRLMKRVIEELNEGLIDVEQAIRELNPDDDEETLQVKIAKATKSHEEKEQQEQLADLDPFSDEQNQNEQNQFDETA